MWVYVVGKLEKSTYAQFCHQNLPLQLCFLTESGLAEGYLWDDLADLRPSPSEVQTFLHDRLKILTKSIRFNSVQN